LASVAGLASLWCLASVAGSASLWCLASVAGLAWCPLFLGGRRGLVSAVLGGRRGLVFAVLVAVGVIEE